MQSERRAGLRRAEALRRRGAAAARADAGGRRAALDGLAMALAAHDPERVVERGYAVVDDREGNVVTNAEAAREAGAVRLCFADAAVDATITEEP
jgi:exodeoxyribonuclease VII large subunit